MPHQRWLRIIPVALVMYTISYVDRTNVSLALDPNISTMMRDLLLLGALILTLGCDKKTEPTTPPSGWSPSPEVTKPTGSAVEVNK